MISVIPDLPGNILGFQASGIVTGEDYEKVLVPAVEEKLGEIQKIRLLYQMGDEFEKFDLGAVWEDAKVGLQHLTAWEKIAVVTDVEWIRSSVKVFGFALPAEVKVFANGEMADAKAWISE